MAHVAHERQARSENINREDWSHSILVEEYQVPFNSTRKVSIKSLKLDNSCVSSLVQKCEPQVGFAIEKVKMY